MVLRALKGLTHCNKLSTASCLALGLLWLRAICWLHVRLFFESVQRLAVARRFTGAAVGGVEQGGPVHAPVSQVRDGCVGIGLCFMRCPHRQLLTRMAEL